MWGSGIPSKRIRVLSRHLRATPVSNIFGRSSMPVQHKLHAHSKNFSSASGDVEPDVLLQRFGTKGVVTLNRVKHLNALDTSMINKIYPQLKEWEENPETTMVIIKGAGEKAFCSGGDIMAITEAGKVGDYSKGDEFFGSEYQLNHAISTCLVPYIALIDGITMGGGVGLSVHGHFRVATERTLFAMPETGIGLFPDVGGSYVLPRIGRYLGLYLALTGFRLKGRDVYKAGIATHMVDSHNLPKLERDLLALENPGMQGIMDLLRTYHRGCQTGRDKEFILADKLGDINRLFAADTMEEIFENLRKEDTEWAQQQLDTLSRMSPTSLKITLRQIMRGTDMDLADCLTMEYRMGRACLRNHDFYEGVRAVLVDKDRNPQWKPSTLEEVSEDLIEEHFSLKHGQKDLVL